MGSIQRRAEKEYTWENIEIGDEYGPVVGVVSDFQVKTHAYAVDDYSPWYFHDSTPFGGRIGHPTLFANDILGLFRLGYQLVPERHPGGLHTRNEIEFLKPVFVGQQVTIRGKNVDKFQKREQNYRVLEGEVTDEAGRVLIRMRATESVGLYQSTRVGQRTAASPSDVITGEVPAGAPHICRAGRYAPEGAVLPSLTKHTTLEQSVLFSGFFYGWVVGGSPSVFQNIHTDQQDARRRGMPDAVVQALISTAYISELCTNFFGPLWLTTGRLATAFIRPVIVRDTITASGIVKRRLAQDGDQVRLELDVWCKNDRGELTTVGRASAQVQ